MLDIGAFMILWQTVEDTVCAAAVSADIRDEFFCSAYCAVFHDRFVLEVSAT